MRAAKGISPVISTAMLVVIAISLATLVSTWMYTTVTDVTNQTSSSVSTQVMCRNAALNLDSAYGNYGILWNFTSSENLLKARVINSGTVDLHTFRFELTLSSSEGLDIRHYYATGATQKTSSDPLRASESAIIRADITDLNSTNATLYEVRIIPGVCPEKYAYMKI